MRRLAPILEAALPWSFAALAVVWLIMCAAASVASDPGQIAWTIADAALAASIGIVSVMLAALLLLVACDAAEERDRRRAAR